MHKKSELQLLTKTMLSVCFSQMREYERIRAISVEAQTESWAYSPLGQAALDVVRKLEEADHMGTLSRVTNQTQQLVNDVDKSDCTTREDVGRFLRQILEIRETAEECQENLKKFAAPFKALAKAHGWQENGVNAELN